MPPLKTSAPDFLRIVRGAAILPGKLAKREPLEGELAHLSWLQILYYYIIIIFLLYFYYIFTIYLLYFYCISGSTPCNCSFLFMNNIHGKSAGAISQFPYVGLVSTDIYKIWVGKQAGSACSLRQKTKVLFRTEPLARLCQKTKKAIHFRTFCPNALTSFSIYCIIIMQE